MHKKHITILIALSGFLFFTNNNCLAQNAVTDTIMMNPPPAETDSVTQFELIKSAPVVEERKVPDSVVKNIKALDAYWYADKTPGRKKEKKTESSSSGSLFDQRWISALIWIILIAGIIFFAIWFLAAGNISLFRRKPVGTDNNEEIIEEENIFSLDYAARIQSALSEKNYRLAIRLLYLSLLKDMADNNIINYKQGKTNREYLSEINNTPFYKSFHSLTRTFEYIWYGKFNLSESEFGQIENNFRNFKNTLQ